MPPADGRPTLRELSKPPQFLPLSAANGSKQLESGSPREQRRSGGLTASHLLSRHAMYWLVWLLLCGCFAIRHTTKLLDAASQQHALLTQPTTTAAAAATPNPMQQQLAGQHASSSSSADGNATSTAAAVLAAQRSKWPDGYVAVCAVIKDQWPDLRYWIEYHRWLGVSKFYIYDNNSTLPAMLMLWDYMQAGVVEYEYFLGRPRRRPDFTDTNQYRAYQGCLLQHFKQHRWLAFIDADEFFVLSPNNNGSNDHSSSMGGSGGGSSSTAGKPAAALQDQAKPTDKQQQLQPAQDQHFGIVNQLGSVVTQDAVSGHGDISKAAARASSVVGSNSTDMHQHNLALFLSEYEGQAALGVNWVLFGSSGHLVRPAEGPLAAYTACIPRTHWESTHVKVIANTGGVLGIGGTPHEVLPRAGKSIVDVDKVPFKGPKTPQAKWHKLVLHHYVLKSKAEFVAKQARGSGAGNKKDWGYWEYVERLANHTCLDGVPVSKAFMASQPALGLPESAHVLQGCHRKAAAAYEALLQSQGSSTQQHPEGDLGSELLPC